jgi:hypothetical protein
MNILLITPPFTQLNTPYPATAYLKGFLNTRGIHSVQTDLGIEVILDLFSASGLSQMFAAAEGQEKGGNSERIYAMRQDYIQTIDSVMLFLQGKNPSLALQICREDFLPEASRFSHLDELDWAFGSMGTQDKAKHLATLYLEDLSDFIIECVDPHFGFSRYAERLGRSASTFDELYEELNAAPTYMDRLLFRLLHQYIVCENPNLVLISVPFPGNLYAAFRCAQYIRSNHPDKKVAMGGGFPNTELRSLSDARVFEFFDFITLDDGEAPVEQLAKYVSGEIGTEELKRTFLVENGVVKYINNILVRDYPQAQTGTPDYSGLPLDRYISVIEVVNPMHRMWSDGRWNKLTMAHGCYWGKCTFCDISLDYIKVYEPVAASLLCDRMEELIRQTGETGFHFVDEAAPPALMRALALEILKRKLVVTWWTNIRFEKNFTADLCVLLRASGCIAVSGGLEVASDRLLKLIDKGVTVAQVAQVTRNFTDSGIMVHAYLMYGYPTQTEQETVDSLEMVRQLFEAGVLQSGFWHQFAMTAHSPVGMYPERFGVTKRTGEPGTFANNDIEYVDSSGIEHDKFSFGLKKSLFNFMHQIGTDFPLQDWFEFRIPKTTVHPDFIQDALEDEVNFSVKSSAKVVWLGGYPEVVYSVKNKKGKSWEIAIFTFHSRKSMFTVHTGREEAEWLIKILEMAMPATGRVLTYGELKSDFEKTMEDFELFWFSTPVKTLRKNGLLVL